MCSKHSHPPINIFQKSTPTQKCALNSHKHPVKRTHTLPYPVTPAHRHKQPFTPTHNNTLNNHTHSKLCSKKAHLPIIVLQTVTPTHGYKHTPTHKCILRRYTHSQMCFEQSHQPTSNCKNSLKRRTYP